MSRVRANQNGYVGFSRSVRAAQAERDGRFPLTRAAARLAADVGCTVATARVVLEEIGACEWHHTSYYANRTKFYEVGDAARELAEASTPAEVREHRIAARLRRQTRQAWLEMLARREERQLGEGRAETGRRMERELREQAAGEAIVRAAQREYEIERLVAAYRRSPSAGREQQLRERGIDPQAVLA